MFLEQYKENLINNQTRKNNQNSNTLLNFLK